MKLLVCDVEGTIFKANYRIKGTDFASTMWQPIAHRLGEKAIEEERQSHENWENGHYNKYLDWVDDTVAIHKRHGLHKDTFFNLINEAEYNDWVLEFFNELDRDEYIPVLISGGFQELVRRAQKDLGISYGYGACEYHFDDHSGLLSHHTKNPSDFEGKHRYVSTLIESYSLNPHKDWIFIGDGKNDVHVATKAPLSFGINAHDELKEVVVHNVSNFEEIYFLINEESEVVLLGEDDILHDSTIARAEATEHALNKLTSELNDLKSFLDRETIKRQGAEVEIRSLTDDLSALQSERTKNSRKISKLKNLVTEKENERAQVSADIENLNQNLEEKSEVIARIQSKIEEKEALFDLADEEITELQQKIESDEIAQRELFQENQELKDQLKVFEKQEKSGTLLGSGLLNNLFKRIDFTKRAVKSLARNKGNDELLNILQSVNSRIKMTANSCVWHGGNFNDAVEYRFSLKGRVIVSFDDKRPLVVDIFFQHEHVK